MNSKSYYEIAMDLKDENPKGKVAAFEIGVHGYFSERHIIDLVGLVSPEVLEIREAYGSPNQMLLLDAEYFVHPYEGHEKLEGHGMNNRALRSGYDIDRIYKWNHRKSDSGYTVAYQMGPEFEAKPDDFLKIIR